MQQTTYTEWLRNAVRCMLVRLKSVRTHDVCTGEPGRGNDVRGVLPPRKTDVRSSGTKRRWAEGSHAVLKASTQVRPRPLRSHRISMGVRSRKTAAEGAPPQKRSRCFQKPGFYLGPVPFLVRRTSIKTSPSRIQSTVSSTITNCSFPIS